MTPAPWRYGAWAGACVLLGAVPLVALALGRGLPAPVWVGLGFGLAAVGAIGGGMRLESLHGSAGAAFLVALGACMLARSFAFAGGAALAAPRGTEAVWAYLAGLGSAYVPAQAFEILWFARKTHGSQA